MTHTGSLGRAFLLWPTAMAVHGSNPNITARSGQGCSKGLHEIPHILAPLTRPTGAPCQRGRYGGGAAKSGCSPSPARGFRLGVLNRHNSGFPTNPTACKAAGHTLPARRFDPVAMQGDRATRGENGSGATLSGAVSIANAGGGARSVKQRRIERLRGSAPIVGAYLGAYGAYCG